MTGSHSDSVQLGATRIIAAPEWMEVVASATAGDLAGRIPVAAIGNIPDGRIGFFAFDIRGHFLLNPDNLEALVQTVDMVKALTAPGDIQIVSTGEYLSIPVAGAARVTSPDGATHALQPDKWGRAHLRPLLEGEYDLESRNSRVRIYANYFDAAESDLARSSAAAPPAPTTSSKSARVERPMQIHPLAFALIVLALVALLAESALLVRRTVRWRLSNV
jgi:hypothetical protein